MENRKRYIRAHCEMCDRSWDIETWFVIDDQKDPEAAQMVCDGVYFVDFCPDCGKEYAFITPTIYYNAQKSAIIFLVDDELDDARVRSMIKEVSNKRNVDFSKGYARITTTCNEFREKVILLNDGLDDRVVELMKLWGLEVIRKEGYNQLFDEARCGINSKTGRISIDYLGEKPRHIDIDRSFYDRFATKMIEALNKEHTPLEVNSDWAMHFAETHDC